MYLKLWSYVLNYVASANLNLVCLIFIHTLMDVIRMPLVKCCNEWRVVLNHYGLGLYVESWLKSFVISGLPGLWELKYRNLITSVIVFVLTFLWFGRFCYKYEHPCQVDNLNLDEQIPPQWIQPTDLLSVRLSGYLIDCGNANWCKNKVLIFFCEKK